MVLSEEAKREHQRPHHVAERFRAAAEMFEFGCAMMRENLARRLPSASVELREELFQRWLRKEQFEYGRPDGR
jgi:hypothetical protein